MSFRFWLKNMLIMLGLLGLWQGTIILFHLPHYIVATPEQVGQRLIHDAPLLWQHTQITLIEILLGFVVGFLLGLFSAISLIMSKILASILLPLMVLSQAIPIFAIAPLLVLWFGYGLTSKIIMAALMLYFPVTAACYDGLRHTPQSWLDIASSMHATPWTILWKIRLPAALPALSSGVRIAISFAPIGAIIGEWVGASEGLGYLMLQANARMQIDLVFAALIILMSLSLCFYFCTDFLLKKLVPWQNQLS